MGKHGDHLMNQNRLFFQVGRAMAKMHERKNVGKVILSTEKEPEPEPEPEKKKEKKRKDTKKEKKPDKKEAAKEKEDDNQEKKEDGRCCLLQREFPFDPLSASYVDRIIFDVLKIRLL